MGELGIYSGMLEFTHQLNVSYLTLYFFSHYFTVEKDKHMVGSYGPKAELQTWTSSEEEFPSGMLARGSYHATSSFTDDDKKDILCWDWNFELKKDWQ